MNRSPKRISEKGVLRRCGYVSGCPNESVEERRGLVNYPSEIVRFCSARWCERGAGQGLANSSGAKNDD